MQVCVQCPGLSENCCCEQAVNYLRFFDAGPLVNWTGLTFIWPVVIGSEYPKIKSAKCIRFFECECVSDKLSLMCACVRSFILIGFS